MIETKRLLLRPLELSDEEDLSEYQSIPEVVRYIPWPERTPEQVHEALLKAISQNDVVNEGDWIVLAIVLKETEKVIGQLNLSIKNSINKYGEFGYVINPKFSGIGYVHEACKALINWAFTVKDFNRLATCIDTRNLASRKVSENLVMRLEATHIEDEMFKGEWTSSFVFAILKREWQEFNEID